IPMLFLGGLPGRLFREFAVTLSVAILISLLISLTVTPMMCAHVLRVGKPGKRREPRQSALFRALRKTGAWFWGGYQKSLNWALAHSRFMLFTLFAAIGLNVYLYTVVPKGFFPQQDTGQLMGFFRVDQGTSFQAMMPKLEGFRQQLLADRAIQSVTVYAGGRGGS